MMDYAKLMHYLKLVETLDLILEGKELVGLWIGPHKVGYPDFSVKGDTVYCRIDNVYSFSVKLPPEWIGYAEKLRDWLISEIEKEVKG